MTTYMYSPSTKGFYHEDQTPPADAVEVSQARYDELFAAQSAGMEITPGAKGVPESAIPAPPSLAQKIAAAENVAQVACQTITNQIVPDEVYRNAYANAATIVWASGGAAPTQEPAKSVFAAQGQSVGASDSDAFAKTVIATSLASMQLSTVLTTFLRAAQASADDAGLKSAADAFQSAITKLLADLNGVGLKIDVPPMPEA